MSVTNFELITLLAALTAVRVLSQDLRGQPVTFNSGARLSGTSQQRTLPRQQTFNQPMTRSQEFPRSNLVRQPNKQLRGNPQLRPSVSSIRDISRSRFLQTNNADQAQRSIRVLPQQTFRQQVLRQQELQQRKQQQEWLQRQRQQLENGVGSLSTRRTLPQGQRFSNFPRLNRVSTQEQGERQRPFQMSGLDSSRRGGAGLSRSLIRPESLPQDPFLRLAVLNNRSPEDTRQLTRRPEQVAELEEQERQLYYLRLREERLQRQANQRTQERGPRRLLKLIGQDTVENLRQQVLKKSQQQQFEQQQQQRQRQQQPTPTLDLEKSEKDLLLAKREKIYNLIRLLGFQPIDLFNIVAALEAGKGSLAPLGQLSKDSSSSEPSPASMDSQPHPVTTATTQLTNEPPLMTKEPIFVTNERSPVTSQPIEMTTQVTHLTSNLIRGTQNLTVTQVPTYGVSNSPLVTTDTVYSTNQVSYKTRDPTVAASQPQIVTIAPDQVTSQSQIVTIAPDQVTSQPQNVTIAPDQVTSQPQIVTIAQEQVTNQPQIVTIAPNQVTSQPQIVTIAPNQMTGQTQIVAIAPDQITRKPQIVTTAPDQVTSQPQIVTIAPDQVTSQPQIVTIAPDQVTSQPQTVTIPRDQVTSQPQIVTIAPDQVTSQPQIVTIAPDQVTSQPQTVTILPVQVTSQPQIVTIPRDQATIGLTPVTSQLTNITTEPSNARTDPVTASNKPNAMANETTNAPPPRNRYNVSIILGMSHAGTTTASINNVAADVRNDDVSNDSFPQVVAPHATNGTLLSSLSTDPANLTFDPASLPAVVDRTRSDSVIAQDSAMSIHRNWTNETANFDVRTGSNESSLYDVQNDHTPSAGPSQMVTNGGQLNDDIVTASKMLLTELISLSQSTSNTNAIVNDKVLLNNIANIISSLMARDPMYPQSNTNTSTDINPTIIDFNMTAVDDANNNEMIGGEYIANVYGEMNNTNANKVQLLESPMPTENYWFQQRAEITSTGTIANYTDSIPDNFFPESNNRFQVSGGENSSPYSEQPQNGIAGADERLSMATAIARMYGIPIDEAMIMLNVPTVSSSGRQDRNITEAVPNNGTASVPFGSEYVPARYEQSDALHDTTRTNTSTTDEMLLPSSGMQYSQGNVDQTTTELLPSSGMQYSQGNVDQTTTELLPSSGMQYSQGNVGLTTTATPSRMHSSQDSSYLTPVYELYGIEPAPSTWSPLNSRQEEGTSMQPSIMNFTELANDNSTVHSAYDRNVVLVWNSAVTNKNLPSLTDIYNETLSSDNLLEANRHNTHNFGSYANDESFLSQGVLSEVNASTNFDKLLKPQTGSTKLDSRYLLTSFNQLAKVIASNVIQRNVGAGNSSSLSLSGNSSSLSLSGNDSSLAPSISESSLIPQVNDSSLIPPANDSSRIPPASVLNISDTFATRNQSKRLEDITTDHSQANHLVSTTAPNIIVK